MDNESAATTRTGITAAAIITATAIITVAALGTDDVRTPEHDAIAPAAWLVAAITPDGNITPAADPISVDVGRVEAIEASAPTDVADGPDLVSDQIGGLAARLHDGHGDPITGDLFLLMGREGSDALARLHDHTPFTHDRGEHAETRASNELAAAVVGGLVGEEIPVVEMTGAPGGGPSGGAIYAIAYLNAVSAGAFTGDLRVTATGELSESANINSVQHIDVKASAAHLAGADVFFTPVAPSAETRAQFGARFVGESVRDRAATGPRFHSPERVALFHTWGEAQRDGTLGGGMDIVDARHLIDVAAYLCGAGSEFACEISDELVRQAEERFRRLDSEAADESERLRSRSTPTTSDGADGAAPSVWTADRVVDWIESGTVPSL